jgi:hypothetical protein
MRTQSYQTQISDLRQLAAAVTRDIALPTPAMSAAMAARCLSGVVNLLAQRFGVPEMQRACGELAGFAPAWTSKLGQLPDDPSGFVREAVQVLAVVARGVLPLAGAANLRAALAFWASETDVAIWSQVAG